VVSSTGNESERPEEDIMQDIIGLSAGLLVARLVFGLSLAAHGSQKLFGWFGGYGLAGTGGFFEQLGYRPGRTFAALAGLAEFGGGLLMAFGLFGPVSAALTISVMIVAAVTVHLDKGFFASSGGIELAFLYAAAAVVLALTGPGVFSLDAVLGLGWLSAPALAGAAIALGVIGGVANLSIRKPAAQPRQATA
jgi:putative oxidoreductase